MPISNQVHIDSALTNLSVAYMQSQDAFIADKVFPIVPVQKKSDRYFVYSKGDFFRDEAKLRAGGTESAGGDYDIDNTPSYFTNRYAFHKDVTDEDRANADTPLKPDEDAEQFVSQKLLIKREVVWSNNYFKAGVWGTNVGGVATGATPGTSFIKWSDYSASNPAKDVRYLKTLIAGNTGFDPNTLTLSYDVYNMLLDHPLVLDRIKYTSAATPGKVANILADLFDVSRVLVAKSVLNTANKGAKDNINFTLQNGVLLSYSAPNPGIKVPSAGYVFAWTGLKGAGAYGNRICRIEAPLLGEGTERIEGEMCFDAKVVGSDLGAFMQNVI